MSEPPSESAGSAPVGSDAETVDAAPVDAPIDSLDREQMFNRVSAGLFGEQGEAPRIEHYFLLERVGAGAMGVVYAAYDPDLDRKVAIKLLKSRGSDDGTDAHHQRLVREARSLAKLSHANVVTVHGVGESERGAHVVMEFVDGMDLAGWVAAKAPEWSEVVEVYLQAARGLAAAHEAGIVHRDFKPQNVLMGSDGVVRVADFGLARVEVGEAPETADGTPEPAQSGDLTRTGGVLGTPLYMAPEQHLGEVLGPAADQYAFCASLFEGVYGQRPFSSRGLASLLESKMQRQLERPNRTSVPRWLARVLDRGLAPKPEDRYPSMNALIEALEAGLNPPRRGGLVAAGAAGLVVVAALVWGGDDEPETPARDPCADMDAKLEGVWDAAAKEGAREAVAKSELSYASRAWEQAESNLDAYSASWVQTREATCREHEAGEESDELFDRRVECLDHRLRRLANVASMLGEADDRVVEHAVDLSSGLPSIEACTTSATLFTRRIRPERAEDRAEAAEVIDEVAHLMALKDIVRTDEIAKDYAEIAPRLETLVDPAARSEMLQLGSHLQPGPDEAMRFSRDALEAAIRSRDDELVLQAYIGVIEKQRNMGQFDLALDELGVAQASLDRVDATRKELGEPPLDSMRAEYANLYGTTLSGRGDHEASHEHFKIALDLSKADAERDPRSYMIYLNNYGEVLRKTAAYSDAVELYDAAFELAAELYGVDHPNSTMILGNRSATFIEMGQFERGRGDIERVLEAQRKTLGERHPQRGLNLFNLALIDLSTGRLEEAGKGLTLTREIFVAAFGEESAYVGIVDATRASGLRSAGQVDVAIELGEEAEALLRKTLPGPHELLATGLSELGATYLEAGRLDRAEATLREALDVFEKSVGLGTSTVATTRTSLGRTLLAKKKWEEAEAEFVKAEGVLSAYGPHPSRSANLVFHAELMAERGDEAKAREALARALEFLGEAPADPVLLGQACAALARLTLAGAERDELVARARTSFETAGPRAAKELAALNLSAG